MLAALAILLFLSSAIQFSAAKTDAITQLSVLVLVPYPDFNPNSGWSNGIELLPAARIAAREMNNRADILPGYNLSLVEASSDACGCITAPIGLSNFVRYAVNNKMCNQVIAVTGLVCSTVTEAVSPIAGRPEVDIIQLSLSISPLLRDTGKYRRLWHLLPSSTIFVHTTMSLIKHFSWNKITLLYSEANVLTESTTDAFIDILSNTTIQHEIIGIRSSPIFIHKALDLTEAESNRIIFASISSLDDLSHLMCEAFSRGLIWPCYAWIFQLLTYNEVLLLEQSFCTQDSLIQALNMSLILNYRLDNNKDNDVLVSGRTYGQFRKEYLDELQKIKSEDFVQDYLSGGYVINDNGNLYSNPMYDELWALGLAINSSLADMKRRGLSLNEYSYNNTPITNLIQEHLNDVKFN
ncbi:PREDICTED: gamma-aminobutyric acid type B receptor subunit 1-like, partial [Amphimedon queenslandica]|uniref:Receptor ligand binding region domain-containing protein n=2 Tax=Amphimedon queenslandica TaxID=400682 RepID=A0AAN0ISV2_AMPQE